MGHVVLFHGSGRPLELAEVPVPEPRGGELLIRIDCCTLCRSDLHTHAGRRTGPVPVILGHEIIGRLVAFGPAAARVDATGRGVSLGDRLTWAVTASCGRCFFCADDLPQKCEQLYKYGHERVTVERPFGGGLADHILLTPGTTWYRIPDNVADRVATPANCATATVAALLRTAGNLAGRQVLILGAGMLGLTACAMTHAAGARTVMVSDPNPTSLERAGHFGATHLFSADADELAARVGETTQGRGADVVIELAGARQSVQAGLSLARIGGVLVLAGTVAPVGTVEFDPEKAVRRMLTIRGVHNYHPRDLGTALTFLAGPGRGFPFEALVGEVFPLKEVERAFAHAHAHPGVRVAVVP